MSSQTRALELLGFYFEEHLRELERSIKAFDKCDHSMIGDSLFIVLAKSRAVVNSAGYLREGSEKELKNGDSRLSVTKQCQREDPFEGPQRIEDLQYAKGEIQ